MFWSYYIATALLIWYVILVTIGLIGWREAWKRYSTQAMSPLSCKPPEKVEGVSILRPLKGLDPNMYENLETTFLQQYPKLEIIFSVADENDQAINVVRSLMTRYPTIDCRIITGEQIVGVNPKVNNLMKPYHEAKYDILWVLDSNVQVVPGALARAVDALNKPPPRPTAPRVGLVHHVPYAIGTEPAVGTCLERAFLNTNHAKMYISINFFAVESCVNGKSNMYRRSDVNRLTGTLKPLPLTSDSSSSKTVTGLPAFAKFLAEDAMIGAAIWYELGLRHELAWDVAGNAIGSMSFASYAFRRARWIRVRKRLELAATLLEPFTESVFVGILVSWAVSHLTDGSISSLVFFIVHASLFLFIDLNVRAIITGRSLLSSERLGFLLSYFGREWLAFPIWLFAIVGNEVEWRGGKYRIGKRGETTQVDQVGRRTALGQAVLAFVNEKL